MILKELRGLKDVEEKLNEIIELKSELDPEFLDENGMTDQVKWREYMNSHSAVVVTHRKLVPRTSYELDFIRLVRYVIGWCRWIEAAEYRMWPRNADGSSPGTPWEQPMWRMRLMDAFWSGQSEIRELREKQT